MIKIPIQYGEADADVEIKKGFPHCSVLSAGWGGGSGCVPPSFNYTPPPMVLLFGT
jgi:hypothetical protein